MFMYRILSVQFGVEVMLCFFFQAEDGIRDLVRSRGLGDVYKRQRAGNLEALERGGQFVSYCGGIFTAGLGYFDHQLLSLIHI